MINLIAHITPTEVPFGTVLFLAGFVAGIVASKLVGLLRTRCVYRSDA